MARKVRALHVITGLVEVKTALTVGSGRPGVDADIQTIRDGLGRLVIPGETLAGCLVRVGGVERWDNQTRASQVWIEHALETSIQDKGNSAQVFDHVNRDRRTGTAVPRGLHSAEVVRPGAVFAFEITVEQTDNERKTFQTVAALAGALRRGVQVGARQSADQGRIQCSTPFITSYDLESPVSMLGRLVALGDEKAPAGLDRKLPEKVPLADFCRTRGVTVPEDVGNVLTISFPLRAASPILSSTAAEGQAGRVPMMASILRKNEEVLRGRLTVRQPLRALAERIERTARGGDARPPASAASDFDRQLLDARCALTQVLFGATYGKEAGRAAAWRQGVAYTCGPVASPRQWNVVDANLAAPRATTDVAETTRKRRQARIRLRQAVEATPGLVLREHNRIEPWSRAPLDGHLFAEIAIRKDVEWEPVEISIDLDRLATTFDWLDDEDGARWVVGHSDEQARAALALVLLTLREACEFGLGVGGGVSRALGWMAIDASEVSFKAPAGPAGFLNDKTLAGILGTGDEEIKALAVLEGSWRRAVAGGDR